MRPVFAIFFSRHHASRRQGWAMEGLGVALGNLSLSLWVLKRASLQGSPSPLESIALWDDPATRP